MLEFVTVAVYRNPAVYFVSSMTFIHVLIYHLAQSGINIKECDINNRNSINKPWAVVLCIFHHYY